MKKALCDWWLESHGLWMGHNFHTIAFCTAVGEWWLESHEFWVVAGQPQFLHNCVLHSLGNGGWKAIGFVWVDGGWTPTILTQLCFAQHG